MRKVLLERINNSISCPTCKEAIIKGTLLNHYVLIHGRSPTEGEFNQIMHSTKRFSSNKLVENYYKNPIEINGGLPSLGKKK